VPIVECGFQPFGPAGSKMLELIGPTIPVDIGFHPAIIGLGTPAPATATGAASGTNGGGSGGNPTGTALPTPLPAVPLGTLMQTVPALIDTGANISCIDEALAQSLQLPLINQINSGGVHGQGLLNVYLGFIAIPLLGTMQVGMFIGAIMNAGGQTHRALLGRTLLSDALLVYDGKTGSVKIAV
jgi:hypothetical protein